MDTKNRAMIGLVSACMVLCGACTAYASSPERARAFQRGASAEVIEKLGLTPEQNELLKANREEFREKTQEIRQDLQKSRAELREEFKKASPDRARIDSITSVIKSLTGQLLDLRVAHILYLKTILTSEQVEKLKAFDRERPHREGVGDARRGGRKDKFYRSEEEEF